MSINLIKEQKINLRKPAETNQEYDLSNVTIGLGWDIAKVGGIFGSRPDYDLDACALLLQENKLKDDSDIISYQNPRHSNGKIWSNGDNLTGAGEGDDEQIVCKLDSLESKYNKVVFYASIYQGKSRNQNFGGVENAFIRLVDNNQKEICKFNLSGNAALKEKCSFIFGEVYRTENGWEFNAIAKDETTDNLKDIARMYK